jgi:hypothetical protein
MKNHDNTPYDTTDGSAYLFTKVAAFAIATLSIIYGISRVTGGGR